MILIGAGHTIDDPGIVYNTQNEYEVCQRLVQEVSQTLTRNNIQCQLVPFALAIKDRAKWIKDNNFNRPENIYLELHLSNNSCAHVLTSTKGQTLKTYLLKYFDTEAEIDTEDFNLEKQEEFEILNKLSALAFVIEAGNIIDYVIDSDYTLTADAIAHAVADYLKVPFVLKAPQISSQDNISPNIINQTMDPTTRREEIKKLYKLILGREADTNGVTYYMVHTDIPLERIVLDMIESTDHAKIVEQSKQCEQLSTLNNELEKQKQSLQKELSEKQQLLLNYDAITQEKSNSSQEPQNYEYPPYNTEQNPTYQPPIDPSQYENVGQQTHSKKGVVGFLKSVMGK